MTDKKSEFIEYLFNAISNDPTMPAELKISLLRLQLPIHKLSQSDPSFISSPKHPARHILSITKKISALAKNNTSVIKKTECILSELLNSSLSINSFSATNQQLEKLSASLAHPSKNYSVEDDSQNQLKQLIGIRVKQCIEGHDIPASCQELILKLWPVALFFILKKYGENSKQWCQSINLYCELLSSIQYIESISQHKKIKDSFMNIVRNNNRLLLLYNQDESVEISIKSLIAHYNHILRLSNFSYNDSTNNKENAIKKIASLPASVKPGIWCEIFIDDITPSRRLRLSLINMDTGTLIFVNRKGIKKLEKDAAVFSEELRRGLSNIYKHDTLFTKPATKTQFKKIG